MVNEMPFDLFILLLRAAFIFLLYFFLYQVVRVISRELQAPPAPAAARAGSPRRSTLTLIDAGQSELVVGAVYAIEPLTTVGRTDDNVLVLPDAFLSSHHARLVQSSGRWYLSDLGSTNGTFVNGRRAGRAAEPVRDGDILQFGRLKLRLALA